MSTKALNLSLLAAAVLTLGTASAQAESKNEIAVTYVFEALSRGNSNWESKAARYSHTRSATEIVYLGVTQDARFGKLDNTVLVGGSIAVRPGTVVSAEIGGGNNSVLPEIYGKGEVLQSLGDGLFLSAGLKRTNYSDAHTLGHAIGLEKYIRNFRVAIGVTRTSASYTSSADMGYRLAVDYYPTDLVALGAFYAAGEESEMGAGGLTSFSTKAYGLRGKKQLTEKVAALVTLAETRYENAYARKAIGLSLEFKF